MVVDRNRSDDLTKHLIVRDEDDDVVYARNESGVPTQEQLNDAARLTNKVKADQEVERTLAQSRLVMSRITRQNKK